MDSLLNVIPYGDRAVLFQLDREIGHELASLIATFNEAILLTGEHRDIQVA